MPPKKSTPKTVSYSYPSLSSSSAVSSSRSQAVSATVPSIDSSLSSSHSPTPNSSFPNNSTSRCSSSSSSSSSSSTSGTFRPNALWADDPQLMELYSLLAGRDCTQWSEAEIDRVVAVNSKRSQYRTKNCPPTAVASLKWFWPQLTKLVRIRRDVLSRLDPPHVIVTSWGPGQPATWQADLNAFDLNCGGNGDAGNFGGGPVPGAGPGGNVIDFVQGQDWFLIVNPRPPLVAAAPAAPAAAAAAAAASIAEQQDKDADRLAAYLLGRIGPAGAGHTIARINSSTPPVELEL